MPSTPSEPLSRPTDPSSSTTSWAIPQPADVISYSYLWLPEATKGQEEGLKDRPSVVIIAAQLVDGSTRLTVAPITHSEPPVDGGVPIPPKVKAHLGLDIEQSWIITTELNFFIWPGPDIRLAKSGDTPHYGAIPAALFERVRDQILANHAKGKTAVVKRTE